MVKSKKRKAVSKGRVKKQKKDSEASEDGEEVLQLLKYSLKPDGFQEECGNLPSYIHAFFEKETIKSYLEPGERIDLDTLSISLRSVYYFNKKANKPLSVIPLFLGAYSNKLEECTRELDSRKEETKTITLEKVSIKVGQDYVFIIPNGELEHFVSVKSTISNYYDGRLTKFYNVKTDVFDSAFDAGGDNQTKLRIPEGELNENASNKSLVPYVRSQELGFYYSMLKYSIIPSLADNLEEKCDLMVDTSLNNSVLTQVSPDDNTCGINAVLCCLLMMVGKQPNSNLHFYWNNFQDYHQYHKALMTLLFISIGCYFMDTKVELVDCQTDKNLGSVKDNKNFYEQFENLTNTWEETKNVLENVFSDDILSLFGFIE